MSFRIQIKEISKGEKEYLWQKLSKNNTRKFPRSKRYLSQL